MAEAALDPNGLWSEPDATGAAPQDPNGLWAEPTTGTTQPGPEVVDTLGRAFIAGLQESSGGLVARGEMPNMMLGEDAPWYTRLSRNIGGMVGDIPAGVVGAGVLSRGGLTGSVIGAFAAPLALREALAEAYTNDYASSWTGAWEIAKAAMKGGGKGVVMGAATVGAGGLAGLGLKAVGAPTAVKATGVLGAELTALTTTAAALEGHLPSWRDFLDNAIILGGAKYATHISKRLLETWSDTGVRPETLAAEAQADKQLMAYLKGQTDVLPDKYKDMSVEQRIAASLSADPRPEYIRQVLGAKDPPKLGEPPIKDPVNYEYVAPDTLSGILRLTEQQYAAEIAKQTRGVVPNKQSAREALELIADGEVVDHVVGTAENAAQVYARAHILKGVTQRAYTKLNEIRGIDEADLTLRQKLDTLVALEQVSVVLADFRGARAEAGRALQVFNKIKKDSSAVPDAEILVKLHEQKGSLSQIADLVSGLKTLKQIQEFIKGYNEATTLEKVLEVYKAASLSGFMTHLANPIGNFITYVVEIPEDIAAATITATRRGLSGDPLKTAQFNARSMAGINGVILGARDALTVMGEVWRQEGAHLEKVDVHRQAVKGPLSKVIQPVFKLLQAEDVPFRTFRERSTAYTLAVDRAVAEGAHPYTKAGRDLIQKYFDNPELGLTKEAAAKVTAKIQQAGAEAVHSQRLGPSMEHFQKAVTGNWANFVFLYVRTPTNLLSWAVQHTPGMNLLSGRWRNDFAAGGERRDRAIARVMIGTGIAYTAFQLAENGGITGSFNAESDLRKTKQGAQWQPSSFLIDGKYYSFQRLEPVSRILTVAADLSTLLKQAKEPEDKAKIGTMLVSLFGNATISSTYMANTAATLNAVTQPEIYGEQLLEQYASGLVPRIIGQTAGVIDPDKREVDGIADSIQAQIPFWRQKLTVSRDVWGEVIKNTKLLKVLPIQTSQASTDKAKTEAVRLSIALTDVPKYILEQGPFDPDQRRIDLTTEQRDIMRQVTGNVAMELLRPRVMLPEWDQTPAYIQVMTYKAAFEAARQIGTETAIPAASEQRHQKREEIFREIMRQQVEAESGAPAAERRVK